jgi:hypothetical protein
MRQQNNFFASGGAVNSDIAYQQQQSLQKAA